VHIDEVRQPEYDLDFRNPAGVQEVIRVPPKELAATAGGQVASLNELVAQISQRVELPAIRANDWPEVTLGEILARTEDPTTVDSSIEYPNIGVYSFGKGVFRKPPILGWKTSAKTLFRVHAGQFIYSRLFAFEGAYGVVPEELDGSYVSNEFPTFDYDHAQVTSAFLETYFATPNVWARLAKGSRGLGNRRQRVQPDALMAHQLRLPPLEIQRQLEAVRHPLRDLRCVLSDIDSAVGQIPEAIIALAFMNED
jgi:hypothetical protein